MGVSLSILLIEDDIVDAELVRKTLSRISQSLFTVKHVAYFRDAITAVKSASYDVVILDLGLPDVAGLNGVEKLVAKIPSVPIIVYTGLDDDEMAIRGIELGAQEFISKASLNGKQLLRSIRHAIKRKQCELARSSDSVSFNAVGHLNEIGTLLKSTAKQIRKDTASLQRTSLNDEQTMLVSSIDKSAAESTEKAMAILAKHEIVIDI